MFLEFLEIKKFNYSSLFLNLNNSSALVDALVQLKKTVLLAKILMTMVS